MPATRYDSTALRAISTDWRPFYREQMSINPSLACFTQQATRLLCPFFGIGLA